MGGESKLILIKNHVSAGDNLPGVETVESMGTGVVAGSKVDAGMGLAVEFRSFDLRDEGKCTTTKDSQVGNVRR